MDTPTTSKHARPFFGRSHSATANLSPPTPRTQAPTQHAARRLHLHPLQTANERIHRHGGILQSAKDHAPGHVIANEFGRMAGKGSKASLNKDISAGHSRRESPAPVVSAEVQALSRVRTRPTRPEDVEMERQRQKGREEELRNTMNGLLEMAHTSTRRLDKIHYWILERVANVRTTIGNLQELSKASSDLNSEFEKNANDLETDMQKLIAGFVRFESQHDRIEELVDRIHASMKRANDADNRLEAARGRVELWEMHEKEWQNRTSKRLRMTWRCLAALCAFIVVLLIIRQVSESWGITPRNASMPREALENGSFISSKNSVGPGEYQLSRKSRNADAKETTLTDPTLRIFDEL